MMVPRLVLWLAQSAILAITASERNPAELNRFANHRRCRRTDILLMFGLLFGGFFADDPGAASAERDADLPWTSFDLPLRWCDPGSGSISWRSRPTSPKLGRLEQRAKMRRTQINSNVGRSITGIVCRADRLTC
jgi:hypothetical protein